MSSAVQGGGGLDGQTALVIVGFDADQETIAQQLPAVRALFPHGAGQHTQALVTGEPAVTNEIQMDTQTDSEHAELIALPLTLLVLLIVFGSVVAGVIPLILAAVAVPVTSAVIYAVAVHVETNIFVLNVVSVLGLGLSIDYSLILVRRFREELVRRRTTRDAVAWTMTTAGEAVLCSGLTVMVGFCGLFFIGIPVMSSFALGGLTIAAIAVLAAITLLPALLSILGPRVNALRLSLPHFRRQQASGKKRQSKEVQNGWQRWALFIMRRPVVMILLVIGTLTCLGWPALSLHPGLPGASSLPQQSEARHGLDLLKEQFPMVDSNPITVIAQTTDHASMLTEHNLHALQTLSDRLAALPRVASVTTLLTFSPPGRTGTPVLSEQQRLQLYSSGAYRRTPQLLQAVTSWTNGDLTSLSVHTSSSADSQADQELIDSIRALNRQTDLGVQVRVGGTRAVTLDFDHALYGNFVWALLFILVATYLLLLLMFRSLLLPLKAILMNMLSIAAAYGALVFIFQQGHFQQLLHFTADGSIDRFIPVLLFCVLFGLSMDYEVFLLSRMKEEWQQTGENRIAVARGLERTGGIITNAALLFVIVSGAFLTASLVVVKELGLGITIAVLVDATIVRTILVPATMTIMGRWNWWCPWVQQQAGGQKKQFHIKHLDGKVLITASANHSRKQDKAALRAQAHVEKSSVSRQTRHLRVEEELSNGDTTGQVSCSMHTLVTPVEPFSYPSYQDCSPAGVLLTQA